MKAPVTTVEVTITIAFDVPQDDITVAAVQVAQNNGEPLVVERGMGLPRLWLTRG